MSERKAEACLKTSGRDEVRPAKSRQEIVKGGLIGEVLDCDGGGESPPSFRMQQVFGADAQIEEVAWLDAIRIVIIVFLTGLRQRKERGSAAAGAGGYGRRIVGSGNSVAGKADAGLLCRCERKCVRDIVDAGYQAAVVAPGELDVLRILVDLVAAYDRRLESLVVVDAERSARHVVCV